MSLSVHGDAARSYRQYYPCTGRWPGATDSIVRVLWAGGVRVSSRFHTGFTPASYHKLGTPGDGDSLRSFVSLESRRRGQVPHIVLSICGATGIADSKIRARGGGQALQIVLCVHEGGSQTSQRVLFVHGAAAIYYR